jgi:hypothetical protein
MPPVKEIMKSWLFMKKLKKEKNIFVKWVTRPSQSSSRGHLSNVCQTLQFESICTVSDRLELQRNLKQQEKKSDKNIYDSESNCLVFKFYA